jgi:Flp pilus assembly protein TadG
MRTRRQHPSLTATRRRWGAAARSEDGNTSIQNIILMPMLFLVIFAIVQAGIYYHALNTARSIANGAVQVTRLEGGTEAAGRSEAAARMAAVGPALLGGTTVSVSRTPEQATVTIDGTVRSMIPGLTLPIRSTATGPVERWAVAP